jgi:hypothetical protein
MSSSWSVRIHEIAIQYQLQLIDNSKHGLMGKGRGFDDRSPREVIGERCLFAEDVVHQAAEAYSCRCALTLVGTPFCS